MSLLSTSVFVEAVSSQSGNPGTVLSQFAKGYIGKTHLKREFRFLSVA